MIISVVMIAVLVPFTIEVASAIVVPSMLVIEVAAWRGPIPFEVTSTFPIRFNPI